MRYDDRARRDLDAIMTALQCPEPHAIAAALHVFRKALKAEDLDEALEGYEDRLTDYYVEDEK